MRNGFGTQIGVVQGNFGYDLNFTLQDSAGVVVDITNATLLFEAQLEADKSVQFSGAMTVVSGINGTCYYQVQSTDFPAPGAWNVQIVATYVAEVITFTGITVTVDSQLPVS